MTSVRPSMTGEPAALGQTNPIIKHGTCALKQLIKNPVHGKNCGAAVDAYVTHLPLVHLAARLGIALEHIDFPACSCQVDGSRQSACAGADNDRSFCHQVACTRRTGAMTARWW